jgi:hypothetical protein
MKDQLGKSAPETAAQIQFRGRTLQTRQGALAMSTAAEGPAQAAIGVNISREAFREGLETVGQLQAMEGSDARAYGKFAGTLALQAKPGTTAQQFAGTAHKLFQIQQPGGFESFAQFAGQYAQTNAYVQNKIYTDAQNAALLSALSLSGPETAATRLEQITRATSSGLMRARGIRGAPGIEHDTSAAYFQKLGITEGMPAMERLNRIADDFNRERAAAEKSGKGFLGTEELIKRGIINAEDAQAIMDFAGIKASGLWDATFAQRMNAQPDAMAVHRAFTEQRGREPVLQQRAAEIAKEAATLQRGTGNAEAGLAQVQQAAFERLKAQGKVSGTFEEWKGRGWWDRLTSSFTGYDQRVNLETQNMVMQEAGRLGIKTRAAGRIDPKTGEFTPEYMGDEALFQLQQQVQRAGGDPLAGVATDIKRAADALEKAAEMIAGKPASGPATGPGGGPAGVKAPMPSKPPPFVGRAAEAAAGVW